MIDQINTSWINVCPVERIAPNTGAAALVAGEQIAIFRVGQGEDVRAVSNYDPFTKANVISRGIIGSRGETIKVASPILKHQFCLDTGEHLEDATVTLTTYPVRVVDGVIQVQKN
jgi:nitrite reductase (NADH) small subunit